MTPDETCLDFLELCYLTSSDSLRPHGYFDAMGRFPRQCPIMGFCDSIDLEQTVNIAQYRLHGTCPPPDIEPGVKVSSTYRQPRHRRKLRINPHERLTVCPVLRNVSKTLAVGDDGQNNSRNSAQLIRRITARGRCPRARNTIAKTGVGDDSESIRRFCPAQAQLPGRAARRAFL